MKPGTRLFRQVTRGNRDIEGEIKSDIFTPRRDRKDSEGNLVISVDRGDKITPEAAMANFQGRTEGLLWLTVEQCAEAGVTVKDDPTDESEAHCHLVFPKTEKPEEQRKDSRARAEQLLAMALSNGIIPAETEQE